ncbi:MAG: hypothetical protein JO061_11600 [Acidobacteriaceae bacterium]|nr:hypothetical protein [Acidobacteriaceae bacterium]
MQAPAFLIPETTIHENGSSPVLAVGSGPVLITVGVLAVVEQETLQLAIHGSSDGKEWSADPLVSFPEKFYPGVSAVYLDPGARGARFIRAQWRVNRWGRASKAPSFRIYVVAEPV